MELFSLLLVESYRTKSNNVIRLFRPKTFRSFHIAPIYLLYMYTNDNVLLYLLINNFRVSSTSARQIFFNYEKYCELRYNLINIIHLLLSGCYSNHAK